MAANEPNPQIMPAPGKPLAQAAYENSRAFAGPQAANAGTITRTRAGSTAELGYVRQGSQDRLPVSQPMSEPVPAASGSVQLGGEGDWVKSIQDMHASSSPTEHACTRCGTAHPVDQIGSGAHAQQQLGAAAPGPANLADPAGSKGLMAV